MVEVGDYDREGTRSQVSEDTNPLASEESTPYLFQPVALVDALAKDEGQVLADQRDTRTGYRVQ